MNPNEQDTRQSIIDAAKELINETAEVEKITIRQIAARAGVGIGLINYHFKSKDNLLSIAIGHNMQKTILSFTKDSAYSELDPVAKLKALLKELYSLTGDNEKLIRYMLTFDIMQGNMQTPLSLVPLLKEIYSEQKSEMQLRILALQIIYPLQVTGLNMAEFHMYSEIDLHDIEQRNRFIDMLVDNLISPL